MINHDLVLKHNVIWIGDTGATMHSTFCAFRGINKRATTISTTGVFSGSIKPLLHIKLEFIAVDKNGKESVLVLLGNVVLLESSNYNLFSLSKLLNSGWKIHGNAPKVGMTNGSKVFNFDIVIQTTKGAIFCAQF